MPESPESEFEAVNLLADPLYRYCSITKQRPGGDSSEEALLDHPWLQRSRRIHQLQSAWWVFHTAEHSRFQHLVGAMHLSGSFADHLYPSLAETCPGTPSRQLVVETMRIAGLLHDVGHGPFGHFFDREVLSEYGIDHEDIGRRLVVVELADLIASLGRSPGGPFQPGERVDPAWVAWVMAPRDLEGFQAPAWLRALKPLLCGPVSTDNMDYVPRDAYMCGVAVGPVDLARLRHYMFIKDGRLVLHQHGVPALENFLAARLYMYNHIYFHRTVRRIDLHLRPVFAATCRRLLPAGNPLLDLDRYLLLTDWSLMSEVERMQLRPRDAEERELGQHWEAVTRRRLPWRLAFEAYREATRPEQPRLRHPQAIEAAIRAELPRRLRGVGMAVDLASTDPRPDDPTSDQQLLGLYDPISGRVEETAAQELMARLLPMRTVWLRVYSDSDDARGAIRLAAARALARAV
ncbi:MAG: HD domain-containing protein [Candidatus Dormibacteria bacterium]